MKWKTTFATFVLAGTLALGTGCVTGPYRLARGWDDYRNQKYTENAWLHGVLLSEIIPFYPIVLWLGAVGDILFINPWYFWTRDAWSNRGTGFEHEQVTGAEHTVKQLD